MIAEGGSSEATREVADATSRPSLQQTDLQAELKAELQAERVSEIVEMGEIGEMGEMGGGLDGGVGEQERQAPALAAAGVARLGPAAAWPAVGVGDGGVGSVGGVDDDDDDDDDAFWRDEQALAQIDEVVRRSVEADAQRCGRSG